MVPYVVLVVVPCKVYKDPEECRPLFPLFRV